MKELADFHIPHYFSKSVRPEIEELSVSTALADFSVAMVTIFEPIFLYNVLHFTVPQVLLFMAAVYFFYIFFISFGAKVASIFGYKHAIAMSVVFQVLYWVLLLAGRNGGIYIFFAPAAFAIEKSLYWPGFHAVVSRYADREQKGREFSFIYAIVNIAQMLGPFFGGYMLQKFGPSPAFFAASLIYVSSAVPLLINREIFVPKLYKFRDTWELYKAFPKKFLGYMGFGEELIVLTVWPIYVFIVVRGYENTGILATGASLAAAIMALVIGKITDSYTKRVLLKVGALLLSISAFLKITARSFLDAFLVDTAGRTTKDVVFIPLSTLTYLRAEATHILPYAVFFEQSLSIGKLLACLLGILIFTLTGSFTALFVLAGLFSLLYMYI
jgi:MFS family permease